MNIRRRLLFFCTAASLALPTLGAAQDSPQDASQSQPGEVEEVVVTARRIEGPMWEVRRPGPDGEDRVLILVGAAEGLPRDLGWRTETLEAAVSQADHVLFPIQGRASLADIGRVIWRMRTLTRLPDGRTTADYLSPEIEARRQAVMDEGPSRKSMLLVSSDLMEAAGYDGRGRPVSAAVRRAVRANRTPAEPVGVVRGEEIVDSVLNTPPEQYLSCIEAAVVAAEAGPELGRRRAEDWRLRRVPAVLASPLEAASEACSLWSLMGREQELRDRWNEAVAAALDRDGVTLAIAPLRLLAEPDGVLDRLEGEGLDPVGPDWRPTPTISISSPPEAAPTA